ncbi:hypothetical protein [Pseudomonas entomophila]|uniref:hypothetical protein n=1 Tax=Pseudomonas entomophila TaxID=312306 RepID=UPI001F012719|nr:hypothetical protein [Pseudomonas entomophila]MCG8294182.1 hypothetical protein [Pseudomonas entomophila]
MTINIWKLFLFGLTVSGLSICTASPVPQKNDAMLASQLYSLEPTPSRSTLKANASGYLATLLEDPANIEVTHAKVDQALLDKKTGSIVIALPTGENVKFDLRYVNSPVAGDDRWEGWVGHVPSQWKTTHAASPNELDNDPFYYLSIVRHGGDLVGGFRVAGKLYSLEQVAAGQHVLIKVDESKLPPLDKPVIDNLQRPAQEVASPAKTPHSTIRLLMVSTDQKRAASPGYRLSMVNSVQTVNLYLANSKVEVTLEIAGFLDADYDEAGKSTSERLADMRPTRALGKLIENDRAVLRADLAAMYSQNANNGCGAVNVRASKENAFLVYACDRGLSYYVGRAFGASNQVRPEGASGYQYGFESKDPKFVTLTLWGGWGGFIDYFSNPRLTYKDVSLGVEDKNDVARFLEERREVIENFYP